MVTFVGGLAIIEAAGNKPKGIEEYVAVYLPAFTPHYSSSGRAGVTIN